MAENCTAWRSRPTSSRVLIPLLMGLLATPSLASGHGVYHQVTRKEAVLVTAEYDDGEPMSYAEVKVTSYGLLTLGGVVAMILGAMMLVDSPLPELRVDPWKLLPLILAFAAFAIALVRLVLQAQRRRALTGAEGLVGVRGEAASELEPEGWVSVQGELWRARSDEPVRRGEKVEVVSMKGLRLRVRKGA